MGGFNAQASYIKINEEHLNFYRILYTTNMKISYSVNHTVTDEDLRGRNVLHDHPLTAT